MKTSRLVEFDVLRVAAMLYVVAFFHLFAYFPPLRHIVEIPIVDMLARVALGAFVFISAYLLASRNKIENWRDVATFLSRRFLRIYPLFFLTLVAFLVAKYIRLIVFIKVALLLTMLIGPNVSTLWFVTMLFLFYLLTPIYLYKYTTVKSALLTVVFFVGLLGAHKLTGLIDLRLPVYLPTFAAGVLAARKPEIWSGFSRSFVIGGGVVLFAAIMLFVLPERMNTQPVRVSEVIWCGLAILGLLPFSFFLSRMAAKIIPARALQLLSEASFAMYLLHRLTYRPLLNLFHPREVPVMLLFSYLVLLPVTFLLATAVQSGYNAVLNRLFPVPSRV